jgi:hypothetical protein
MCCEIGAFGICCGWRNKFEFVTWPTVDELLLHPASQPDVEDEGFEIDRIDDCRLEYGDCW